MNLKRRILGFACPLGLIAVGIITMSPSGLAQCTGAPGELNLAVGLYPDLPVCGPAGSFNWKVSARICNFSVTAVSFPKKFDVEFGVNGICFVTKTFNTPLPLGGCDVFSATVQCKPASDTGCSVAVDPNNSIPECEESDNLIVF